MRIGAILRFWPGRPKRADQLARQWPLRAGRPSSEEPETTSFVPLGTELFSASGLSMGSLTGHDGIRVRERHDHQLDRVASVLQAVSNVSDHARVAAFTARFH